ncbi:conjugal transfer protein TraI [Amycolatopsis mediterranei]|uniref:conjugal transfer protein TraI n=1 Tax=Amycolatopsis mediterranei TaxID=33910 RepID=UPI0008524831|nr:conjugal transfer protein TraI [Amycolatopsis mediterranei]
MSTTKIAGDDHDDDGGEVGRGLAALERHLAAVAPPAPAGHAAADAPEPPRDPEPASQRAGRGVTRRVRRRVAEHAEAHQLLALETDTAPFQVTTDKVRTRRKAVEQAAALWRLDRDPRVLAYRDARMRRLILAVALVSLTLALAWSTAGVQAFAAEGAAAGSPRWWFAWLAEPFCSLALLMVVSGRAYLTTRGHPLNDRAVDRTEWVFLGLTLGMNAWPHLPGVAASFTVSGLVLHLLGPVVAVAVVRCLPRLLAAFAGLALPTGADAGAAPAAARGEGRTEAATGEATQAVTTALPSSPTPVTAPPPASTSVPATRPAARRSTTTRRTARATIPEPKRRSFAQLAEEFAAAVADPPAGFDPSNGESIRKTLQCGKTAARELKARYLAESGGSD